LEEIPEKRLLDFDDTPLSELVRVLNQDNATQIEFADPESGEMKITASLRSGNPDGFVRLLEITMDLRAERVGSSKIVLHLK
jgi:ferric-dicitrate binding protein FerR (iron transport regulator)